MFSIKTKDQHQKTFQILTSAPPFNSIKFESISTLMICEHDIEFQPEDYVHLFDDLRCDLIKIIKTKRLSSIMNNLECLTFLFPHLFVVIISKTQLYTKLPNLVFKPKFYYKDL